MRVLLTKAADKENPHQSTQHSSVQSGGGIKPSTSAKAEDVNRKDALENNPEDDHGKEIFADRSRSESGLVFKTKRIGKPPGKAVTPEKRIKWLIY